jgi:hypothetical protein
MGTNSDLHHVVPLIGQVIFVIVTLQGQIVFMYSLSTPQNARLMLFIKVFSSLVSCHVLTFEPRGPWLV